jgi:uncharacterized membrane protein
VRFDLPDSVSFRDEVQVASWSKGLDNSHSDVFYSFEEDLRMDRIEERLGLIESRLTTLEEAISSVILDLEQSELPSPAPVATPQVPLPPQSGWSGPYQMAGTPSVPQPQTAQAKPKLDVNWLGVVAVICFVLAAGFIIKLAVESGWLTPERQIGLSCLLGFSLIGAGLWLRKADKEFASFLPGAGIVVLYLSFLAAHAVHHLVPATTALGLITLVSAACVWLYDQLKLKIYLFTAMIGSYVAPLILGKEIEIEFSLAYYSMCSIAFASIAIWLEERLATIVAAYLAILMTSILGLTLESDFVVAWALAFQFVIFVGGTAIHSSRKGRPLSRDESWAFFPVLLVFYASEYYFIEKLAPTYAPWFSIAFAAFLIGIYEVSKRALSRDSRVTALNTGPVITAYATIVFFHAVYLELLPEQIRPWLLVAIAAGIAFSNVNRNEVRKELVFPMLSLGVIAIIEYIRIANGLITEPILYKHWLPTGFATVAMLGALYVRRRDVVRTEQIGFAILSSAHLMAILSLYRLLESSGSLAVSVGWLAYAAVTIALGFKRKDPVLAKSALMVLSLSAAKALLYDASSAPTVVRIVCLLVTGAALYGCGFLLRKISTWKPS